MSPVSSVRCPSCGSAAPAAEEFCRRCGNDLTSPGLLPILDDPERTEVIEARAADRMREREPERRARRRVRVGRVLAGVLAAAMLFVGGYAGYRVVADRRAPQTAGQPGPGGGGQPSQSAPPSGSAPGGQSGGQPTGDGRPGTPEPPPRTGPLVAASPALADRPETAAVVALFTTYFDGINRRDYDAVQGTFTDTGRPVRDQDKFEDEYRTTHDTDVRILDIARTDEGYSVSINFTSYQNPDDAPHDSPYNCLSWSMTYPVVRSAGHLLINDNPSSSDHRSC